SYPLQSRARAYAKVDRRGCSHLTPAIGVELAPKGGWPTTGTRGALTALDRTFALVIVAPSTAADGAEDLRDVRLESLDLESLHEFLPASRTHLLSRLARRKEQGQPIRQRRHILTRHEESVDSLFNHVRNRALGGG